MSASEAVNLARRPFTNSRPVVRIAILLWALSGLVLAANVFLFWSYLSGSHEQRARLADTAKEVEESNQTIGRLQQEVEGFGLGQQNERVMFLNEKIAERTFSWSALFDRLAAVMPAEVRLRRLTPVMGEEGSTASARQRRRAAAGERAEKAAERVTLVLGGEATNRAALLRFVDNLFDQSEVFEEPDPTHESKDEESGLITFDLKVTYLPRGRVAPDAAAGTSTIEEVPVPAPSLAAPTEGVPPGAPGASRGGRPPAPAAPAPAAAGGGR